MKQIIAIGIFSLFVMGVVPISFLLNVAEAKNSDVENHSGISQVILQLIWDHHFQFAGYYAAIEKGFYKEAGIEVILAKGDKEKKAVDIVLSEKANFGIANSEILLHRMNGKPVVVLAAIFQHSPSILITRKETGITNPQDMLGRRVKINQKKWNIDILAMFLSEGIKIELLNFVPGPITPKDYLDRSIDVLSGYSFNEPFYLIQEDIPFTIISPQSYGIDFYGDCLFTSEMELNRYPERVKAFREASIKGWRYALDHPNEIIDLIISNYDTPFTRDHLCFEAGKIRDVILPELVDLGHMNPGRWEQIANIFIKLNLADPEYSSLEEFIYDPNFGKNYRQMKRIATITFLFSILALFVVFILLLFNRRLQSEISKRKQIEIALRESEMRYRTLFENMMDGIVVQEARGTNFVCIDANHQAEIIIGIKRAVMLGKSIDDLLSEFRGANLSEIFLRVHQSGKHEHHQLSRYNNDQLIQFLEFFVFKLPSEEIVMVFSDETERKLAEEELRTTSNYLDNIIDSSPSVIIGIDLQCHITAFNHAAEELFDITESYAFGKSFSEVIPDYSDCLIDARNAMDTNQVVTKEKVQKRHKNSERYMNISVYPLVSNGIVGAVIRIDDVTERVRMEETMIQTEKMMSVGGLAAGMAHEINNPLGGILQSAQNILRRLSYDLPINEQIAQECQTSLKSIREYLDRRNIFKYIEGIRQSGERASKIVSNMLNFSRRSESKMAPVDLAELINKTVDLASHDYDLKRNYDFRKIEIIRDYEPHLPLIPCIETEIEQVILNILRNSAQAMAEHPFPNKKPQIHIRLTSDTEFVHIEIEDNGPGMSDSVRKRVFEPFFTTKQVGIGTGLGLSVSYFIITNNHKGSIRVDSELGKGTKFTILLPMKRI